MGLLRGFFIFFAVTMLHRKLGQNLSPKTVPQGSATMPAHPVSSSQCGVVAKWDSCDTVYTLVSFSTICSWYSGRMSIRSFTWLKANSIAFFTANPPPQQGPVRGAYAPMVRFFKPPTKAAQITNIYFVYSFNKFFLIYLFVYNQLINYVENEVD